MTRHIVQRGSQPWPDGRRAMLCGRLLDEQANNEQIALDARLCGSCRRLLSKQRERDAIHRAVLDRAGA